MDQKQLLMNMFGKLEYYLTTQHQGKINPPPKDDGQEWMMSDFRQNPTDGGIWIMWVRNNDKL